jgi:hypothetical protein
MNCKLVHKHDSNQTDCKITPIHYPLDNMVLGHTFHNSIFRIYRLIMKQTEVPTIFAMSNNPSTCNKIVLHSQERKVLGKQDFMI